MPVTPSRPPSRRTAPGASPAGTAARSRDRQPLNPRELDELQALLDRTPPPLEPLDVSMVDGYLCGVLLQPQRVPVARWLPHVFDVDGRSTPPAFDISRARALLLRRHAELDDAIGGRRWFDPWVFELGDPDEAPPDATPTRQADNRGNPGEVNGDSDSDSNDDDDEDGDGDGDEDGDEDKDPAPTDAVYPWVAGFATALELFPALMALDARALTEPLALVYRHLSADDLEDADDLLAEIDSLEPPQDLAESVEGLVRATLLLADISRPVSAAPRAGPPRRGRPSDR